MDDYRKGRILLEQGELAAAREVFQKGIKNDPKCYYGLLVVAIKDRQDPAAAAEQLHKAVPILQEMASNADAEACFILGRCSETGIAMLQDIPEAMVWYTRAAGLGCADAMFNLGCIYISHGSEDVAVQYFERAARLGCIEAQKAAEHYFQTKQKEG